MDEKFSIYICTGPLNEDWLVADVFYDHQQVANLLEWGDKIQLYGPPDGLCWTFSTDDFLEVIQKARKSVDRSSMRIAASEDENLAEDDLE